MKKTLIHNCIVYFIQTVSSQTPGDYYVPFSLPGDETFDQWYQPPDNKSNKKENISQGSLSSPLSANLIQTSFDPSCIPLGYLNRQQNNCCFVDVGLLVMLSRKTPPLHVSRVCVRMFSPWPKLQVTYLFTSSYVTPPAQGRHAGLAMTTHIEFRPTFGKKAQSKIKYIEHCHKWSLKYWLIVWS